MSFLNGLVSFGKKALGNNLVQIALLGYAVNKLSKNALKDNNPNGSENIDGGVRLQLPPATNNKVPVLYGEAYFGGTITDAELTANNQTMHYVLTLAERSLTLLSTSAASDYVFKDVYWNDARIVFRSDGITADYTVDRSGNIDRSISGLVKVYCYGGSSVEGQVPENYTNNSVPDAYTVMPSWDLDHLMSDLIFAVVEVTYNREKNITGLGDMLFQVSNTMKYPGDVLYDYFTNEMYGAGIPTAEIDTTSLAALNTYAQQSVSYEDQGTGAETLDDRYQINGLIDTNDNVMQNIEKICSAAGSWLSYDVYAGKWGVIVNRAGSSVASFNDSNIIGNVSIQGTGLQDLYNSVKVEFPHRDLRDSADFVTIEIPDGDRNANEYDNTLNISYDIINEAVQAQLLGFIELKQSRVDLLARFQTDYSYLNLKAGEIVDITNARAGWTNKLFRIISITERQENDGPIILEFIALEYDSNVYSTADLYRYTRTDENGIITIGSIGVPGTPQVTKFEVASRPRVLIESTAPTGVVSGMEFWLTTDVSEADDADRSYTLISTRVPPGGGVYSSGTTVTLDYDNLGATDFLVKTRGFNATTVGPFSDPSGLVEFVPTQVTDAIGPDTGALDSLGGLLTALAVVDLLQLLDELYSGITGGTSLLDKIIGGIEEATGIDFGDGAIQGPPGENAIEVQDEGTVISTSVKKLNFVGTDVRVELDGDTANIIHTEGGTTPPGQCYLRVSEFYPPNRTTFAEPVTGVGINSDEAPTTGSYFIKYAQSGPTDLLGSLVLGTGNIYLYKSNGTLVSTLSAGSCSVDNNVLEIPFPTREAGTDYYILMDEGIVEYCDCISSQISVGESWNFNTPLYSVSPYSVSGDIGLRVISTTYSSCPTGEFKITFNGAVAVGSGSIQFSNGTTIDASTGTLEGSTTINYGVVNLTLQPSTEYTITIPQGVATVDDGCSTGPSAAASVSYTSTGPLAVTDVIANSATFEPDNNELKVNRQSNIGIVFNQNIQLGPSGTISIGSHQTFNVAQTFASNKVSELFWVSGNTLWLNPTLDFATGSSHTITASGTPIRARCGEYWDNTFGDVDNTINIDSGPVATIVSPTGGSTGEVSSSEVEIAYDRDISRGSGSVRILNSTGTEVGSVPATDPSVTLV